MGIAVLGAGSWGTALALLLARNGQRPVLWGRDSQHMDLLAAERCNARYLPAHYFPDGLTVSSDFDEAVDSAHDVLVVVPSHAFRGILDDLKRGLLTQRRSAAAEQRQEDRWRQL